MIYIVEEGKADCGAVGFQDSKFRYTFSHWKGKMGTRWSKPLPYKPIGPTVLVEWTDE